VQDLRFEDGDCPTPAEYYFSFSTEPSPGTFCYISFPIRIIIQLFREKQIFTKIKPPLSARHRISHRFMEGLSVSEAKAVIAQ